jgi:transposase
MSSRIEIAGRVSGRRRWTVEQKLAILREAFGPGGSVQGAMRRHELSNSLLYTWRHKALAGTLDGARPEPGFAEVELREPAMLAPRSRLMGSGQIGLELPSGVRITVDSAVDAGALSRVIGVLTR